MAEELEQSRTVRTLPIFPLPLVLLPQELLPLHIFEPRYQQMLLDVGEVDKQFGIIHFDRETSLETRPAEDSVGCIAHVRASEMLDDGRSNITVAGSSRFKLQSYVEKGDPYLLAEVLIFNDEPNDEENLHEIASRARELFGRMAAAAFRLSGGRGTPPEISGADPESLSFLIAAAFNFENERKDSLLRLTSTSERLTKLNKILDQAVTQLETNAEISTVSKTNGHGGRKIDL